MTADQDLECLRRFVEDDADLERLEAIVEDFNLFSALGMVHHEIRHSAFLRWILDPSESHGLGAYPLRVLLKRASGLAGNGHDGVPTVFDLDQWDLSNADVASEWENIDLVIRDDPNRFVCAIENKVGSSEHDDQLQRYRETVDRRFPDYKKLLLFLTVSGHSASDASYVPITYHEITDILEQVVQRKSSQLSDKTRLFVDQYIDMVRRYHVEESELHELCEKIYRTHRRALDLIFEHRPDRASILHDAIVDVIKSRPDIILEKGSKSYIRFIPKALDFIPHRGSGGWSHTKRFVLFEFEDIEALRLKLTLASGDPELRKRIYELAKQHSDVFGHSQRTLAAQWHTLYSDSVIQKKAYAEAEADEVKTAVSKRLDRLLNEQVPAMADALRSINEG